MLLYRYKDNVGIIQSHRNVWNGHFPRGYQTLIQGCGMLVGKPKWRSEKDMSLGPGE